MEGVGEEVRGGVNRWRVGQPQGRIQAKAEDAYY